MVELRVGADPSLPFPLDNNKVVAASDRVCHLSLWKNTYDGKTYVNVAYGTAFDKGHVLNPVGSAVAVSDTADGYVLEARIPWSALNAPGGKNPYEPGQRMTATIGVHWGFEYQIPMLYTRNPGSFAFHQSEQYGANSYSVPPQA